MAYQLIKLCHTKYLIIHSFNNKVAREFRPFLLLTITSQNFLTKLVSQLGHFAPESFAQGSCEVGARPLVVLTLSWEWFWSFLKTVLVNCTCWYVSLELIQPETRDTKWETWETFQMFNYTDSLIVYIRTAMVTLAFLCGSSTLNKSLWVMQYIVNCVVCSQWSGFCSVLSMLLILRHQLPEPTFKLLTFWS